MIYRAAHLRLFQKLVRLQRSWFLFVFLLLVLNILRADFPVGGSINTLNRNVYTPHGFSYTGHIHNKIWNRSPIEMPKRKIISELHVVNDNKYE